MVGMMLGIVPHLAPASCTVHIGGFIQGSVHAGKGGKVNDGIPAQFLPDVHRNVQGLEILLVGQQVGGRETDFREQEGQNAVGTAENDHETADHHGRNEVRHIGDGLHDLLERAGPHFVEKQGKKNGQRETEDQESDIDGQRVSEQTPEERAVQKGTEVLQSHPFAVGDAADRVIVLEGNHYAVHGQIVEDNEVGNGRKDHQIQPGMLTHVLAQPPDERHLPVMTLNFLHKLTSCVKVSVHRDAQEVWPGQTPYALSDRSQRAR